uniref:Uncharacterized protein n=1 Tax=Oryza barthii TaxID=65489 RepID=A0A0D3F4P1_9ORYZ
MQRRPAAIGGGAMRRGGGGVSGWRIEYRHRSANFLRCVSFRTPNVNHTVIFATSRARVRHAVVRPPPPALMCATQSSVRPAPPSSVRHRLYPRQPRRCPFAAAIVVVLRSFRASKRGHRACLGRSSACGARRCSRAEPGAASRWRRYDAGSSLPGLVSSMPWTSTRRCDHQGRRGHRRRGLMPRPKENLSKRLCGGAGEQAEAATYDNVDELLVRTTTGRLMVGDDDGQADADDEGGAGRTDDCVAHARAGGGGRTTACRTRARVLTN